MIFHQRKVGVSLPDADEEAGGGKQQIPLTASNKFQEEERQRIAADFSFLRNSLLATTARLYLNKILNQEKAQQLQSIFSAKTDNRWCYHVIRNISHSLMPLTLKNFGLRATNDLFLPTGGTFWTQARFQGLQDTGGGVVYFRIVQELVNNIIATSNAGLQ